MNYSNIEGEVFDMFLGLPGQGKTLTLNEDIVLPALLSGQQVYCSYWVNWNRSNFHYFKDFEEIDDIRNAVVVFDEVGNILNPRDWDNETGNVRDFFMLHRHRYLDIYASTQHISLIAKTALIQVDRFYMCQRSPIEYFIKLFKKSFPYVIVKTHQMTLNDIRLLDMPVINNEDEQAFKSLSTDVTWYNYKKLLHNELSNYKQELIHRYCPICKHRQGEPIKKEDTDLYSIKIKNGEYLERPHSNLGFCPKHTDQPLTIKQTGMFDSHYTPEVREQKIIFKPFVNASKLVPYRGTLNSESIQEREQLKKLNN